MNCIHTLGKHRLFHPKYTIPVSAAVIAAFFVSCAGVQRTVVAPPSIPGAEFVGMQECAQCHEELVRDFRTADHARLVAKGPNAIHTGCESCHGAGSLHSQAGGGRHNIINPKESAEVCFQCHLDKRGEFNLPHRHPLGRGRVTCSNCHDPHMGQEFVRGGITVENDTCGQCHTAQRGPFVFEHEAVREGCTVCHTPHGSVNDKMLLQRNANLCLKCHMQQQTQPGRIVIGGRDHTGFLSRGTCWSAGCHEAVHGSHISSSLRF